MNKTLLTLLIGVAIGIFVAPDKGSTTVRKLKRKFNDWKDDATDHAMDLADSVTDHAMDLADNAREAFSTARSKVDTAFD